MTFIVRLISAIVLLLTVVNSTTKDTLRVGVLISIEGDLNLSGYIPSMNLALESIENDTTLPFKFHATLNDSRVCSC